MLIKCNFNFKYKECEYHADQIVNSKRGSSRPVLPSLQTPNG